MNGEQKEDKTVPYAPSEDWFLQTLVDMVNRNNWCIGITLNVGGFLVSGLLASGKEYFEGFGKEFSSAFQDEEVVKSIQESFSSYGKIYDREQKEETTVPPPSYIHLKDTRFYSTSGGPIPSNRGVWWRGRISEVQGFILGNMSKDQA